MPPTTSPRGKLDERILYGSFPLCIFYFYLAEFFPLGLFSPLFAHIAPTRLEAVLFLLIHFCFPSLPCRISFFVLAFTRHILLLSLLPEPTPIASLLSHIHHSAACLLHPLLVYILGHRLRVHVH
ncbi:hypothetical protein FB451DRAFT_1282092 [Mycena latifolia]|nr:hypothetical protein FB451DRAFT_1282092 [Mycena latifolia]